MSNNPGEKVQYQIKTWDEGAWTTAGLGDPGANVFSSVEAARRAIAELRILGPTWKQAKYRIREIQRRKK